jgi:DNA-binding NtrC family response regulator
MAEATPNLSPTVLLVEDDDQVRGAMRRMLKELGYSTLEARNGRQAIDLLVESREPIKVLFTDVIMPFVRGDKLAEIAVSLRPDIRVVYTSGHVEDRSVREHISKQPNFLEKPFHLDSLREVMNRVLGSEVARA